MRAQTCNQVVAKAIRKFGLAPVRAAVEMAVELSDLSSNEIQKPRQRKPKASLGVLTKVSDATS